MTTNDTSLPTPVVLFAGFLGAGKTTFLRALLPLLGERGIIPHVFVNDFRNAWVDAQTLKGLARDVVAIHGSCVCCDSRDNLLDAMAAMSRPRKAVALIEANGAADTLQLIEILAADKRAAAFRQPAQLTVIDAKRWQHRHWHNELEQAQVRSAGFLHLTKLDEVDATRAAEVRHAASAIQPKAVWTTPEQLAIFVDACAHDGSPRSMRAGVDHVHNPSMHHLSSMQLELPQRVSRDGLDAFLRALPAEVIRVKGVAVLSGPPARAVLFQRVDAQTPPQYMDLGGAADIAPVAILIGVALDESEMINLARRTLA